MNDVSRGRDSMDEGELSDASGRRSMSQSPRRKDDSKKPLHKRITYNVPAIISDDESGEMFAIQPKDSKYDRRDKEKHFIKHKHDEKHRERHEEKHKRREEKRSEKDKREKDRSKDRHLREKEKEKDKKRHGEAKRHRSPSPIEIPPKKREKKPSETKEKIPLFAHTKEKFSAKKIEVQEVEHSPPPEKAETSEEVVIVTHEAGITSFTLDSPAGPMKYSRFDDSSPENYPDDAEPKSPDESDVELVESEPEDFEESAIEPSFDVENTVWEDLSEEQKAMLTPDTKKRLEDEWQARLIADLPIYYPGIQGCRNVEEFKCENKIEEGTYGVVFRARDKRTEEVVALKRLKMEKEREGFPITSLREINMLLKCGNHPNVVNVREVVIGSTLDKIYLVMEFVEHDMKALMETMRQKGKIFNFGVQKGLMIQLLAGLNHMHDLWILHRDLKTSNLLLSHKGVLKIADFGLAREFGEPLKPYTSVVVTLWYRAPELLLEQKLYSTPIDMWSVGCIMGEFVLQKPLFPGQSEQSQIDKIFLELGTPNDRVWPGYKDMPLVKKVKLPEYPYNQLRKKFPAKQMTEAGFQLLNEFLAYDPERRITAAEALKHAWFTEDPKPTPPEMFPTFPAKSEHHKPPPMTSHQQKKKESAPVIVNATTAKLMAELNVNPEKMRNSGFSLKF